MKLVDVTDVEPIGGTTVRLSFSDGAVRERDLAPLLRGPIFAPLRDPDYFRRVRVVDGSIAWPNGADIDPQVLRYDLQPDR